MIQLAAPDISLEYFLRTSGDEAVQAVDQRAIGMVLSGKAEAALSGWTSVDSRFYSVWFQGLVGFRKHAN